MKIIETIILGIVQGIAEFLPISSSAHLIIFRDIFGIGSFISGDLGESFDIALHFGTFMAILVFFFKDFWKMFIKGFTKGTKDQNGKMMWMIVAATKPAAIAGVLLEKKLEDILRSEYLLIALALAIMGIIIKYTDKLNKETRGFKDMTFKDAILIGCAQIFALMPGFSRSGTTIAMARTLKINRSDAAKFSFYLSAPVVLGAVAMKILDGKMFTLISSEPLTFALGVLISFASGILCIKFLLSYIKKHDYNIFMWYRLILALIVLIVLYLK